MKRNSGNYLKSPDLLPISYKEKSISTTGFFFMWIGMSVLLATFAIGAAGIQSIPLGLVVTATFIGSLAIGIFITLIGDIGIEHGISFPVYMRAPFGIIGTHFPSIIRAVSASFWFGVNTYFGATAINVILNILYGYDNWFICFLVFALFQLTNTALGIKWVERFAEISVPFIIIVSIWMYSTLSTQALEQGRNVWTWVENPVSGVATITAFMVVVFANMGFWATLGADIPTISRHIKAPKFERNWFKRNKGILIGSVIALPLTGCFMIMVGAASFTAASTNNPVIALQDSTTGWMLWVLLVMVILTQWSTNISANLVPASAIYSNAGGPKVSYAVAVFIAGIVGIVIQPWNVMDIMLTALLIIGAILSSITGVLFVDYYILRKRRVNVPDLYKSDGQYSYWNGINVAGFLSWIIGGAAACLFLDYSFIIGFIVGSVAYYVLAKHWWFNKYNQNEIEDPDDEKYLGITVGRDWVIDTDVELDSKDDAASL